MNGIYLHIPFCKRRCIYCDFYSTAGKEGFLDDYVEALCNELRLRKDYLPDNRVDSLYIGGGTPSLLKISSLHRIFDVIAREFSLQRDAEVTIEVNPDDITETYSRELAETPINRVSMGIQSFHDGILKFLNRRHTGAEARRAVERLHGAGFDNLSVDLIYGIPGQTVSDFKKDVESVLALPVRHLSSYSLMYEEGTLLTRFLQERKVQETDDEEVIRMFYLLKDRLEECGWVQYEISNFSQPGYRAVHNSGYWKDMYYLGCGPSAHSYDHVSRCWNKPGLKAYVEGKGDVEKNHLQEREVLSVVSRRNEWVMKSLRTREGIDMDSFSRTYGEASAERLLEWAAPALGRNELSFQGNILRLTRKGIFVSDTIMSDLMEVE